MKLVIRGAHYYDRESKTILIPHFTGEFTIVDCTRFEKMEDLKDKYDDTYIDQVKNDPIEFEGEQYYNAEYSPQTIGDWELLSDLSDLEYLEQNYDW